MVGMLIEDNGMLIYSALNPQCKARFITAVFGDKRYYIACNRAAKRFLSSNTAKHLGLEIDLEAGSIG